MHIPFKEAQDAQVTEKACEIRAWETGGGALERPIGLLVLARTSHQRIALRRDHLRADRFIACGLTEKASRSTATWKRARIDRAH